MLADNLASVRHQPRPFWGTAAAPAAVHGAAARARPFIYRVGVDCRHQYEGGRGAVPSGRFLLLGLRPLYTGGAPPMSRDALTPEPHFVPRGEGKFPAGEELSAWESSPPEGNSQLASSPPERNSRIRSGGRPPGGSVITAVI
jgi:hypothetical protein